MSNEKYIVTFELAFVYTIILSALIFAFAASDEEDAKPISSDVMDYRELPPLEPLDTCLCDHGVIIVENSSNLCNCVPDKMMACSCRSCSCSSKCN